MAPKGQESFKFEEEPLQPEPAQESGKSPSPEEMIHLVEREDACDFCGAPFESEGSCVRCRGDKRKLDYLKNKKSNFDNSNTGPVSRGALITAEIEHLRKTRPDIAGNENALLANARINVSERIDPKKLKPPEDPNYH